MAVHTTEKEITIRGIRRLTDKMLAYELADEMTLGAFLANECTIMVQGDFKMFTTTNWAFFRTLEENRFVNEAHVHCLMDSFVEDGYLFTILYVNEKMQIIDGQHRFEAAKRKGLPVHFIVMPGWGIKEVTILNVNSRNWTIVDFMETHAKSGNPNYIRFKEFFDAHEFEITVCQLILTGRRSKGYASVDKFRTGQMQVDDRQITEAYLRAKKIMELRPFHPQGWKSRNFIEAILTLFNSKGYDHAHMLTKLTLYPELLLAQARSLRVDEYITILREKYNFRRQKDKLDITRR